MSGKPKDKRLFLRILADFVDHPKVIEAIAQGGADAGWLWLCALSWSRRKLTDGHLPSSAVRTLAASFTRAKAEKLAAALVSAGLWELADGGYQIHDFADFAPTKEQVEQKREASKEYMRTLREQRAANKAARGSDVTGNKPPTSDQQAPMLPPSGADVGAMCGPVTEVSEVSDPPNPPDPSSTNTEPTSAARRDGAPPSGPTAPTEGDIVRAYVRGVEDGTAGPFGRKLDADDRGQLTYLWEQFAEANEAPIPADFLGRLTDRVAEWVRGKNNPTDRKFQAGWAVKRFVAWLQEQSDGAQDAPEAAPPVSPWGDPTPDELAALRATQGAA